MLREKVPEAVCVFVKGGETLVVVLAVPVLVDVRLLVDVGLRRREFDTRGDLEKVADAVELLDPRRDAETVGLAEELREGLVLLVPVGLAEVVLELDTEDVPVFVRNLLAVQKLVEVPVFVGTRDTVAAELALAVFVATEVNEKGIVDLIDLVDVVLGVTRDVGAAVRVLVVVFVDVFDAVVVKLCTAALSSSSRSGWAWLAQRANSRSQRISTEGIYAVA